MTHSKNSTTLLQDFAGRRVTATAIFFAAFGSAALNIWGATQIFPNPWTAAAFATVVTAGEVIAFLALRHIMADRANNHFWKSRLGALILALSIAACVISGHRAFHTLSLEAEANHGSLVIRAEAAQREADKYLEILLQDDKDVNRKMWERRQDNADAAKLAVLKAEPLPAGLVYVFLALFEVVKIGGLWALATPTTMGLTKAQRRAQERQRKIKEAKSQAEFERKLKEAEGDESDSNVLPLRAKS
jgi:succinate dehydrogenase hydrophobic anchor subunit